MWTRLVPEAARRELHRAFSGCGALGEDPEPFLASVLSALGGLGPELTRALLSFRADPAALGALLLRGMPVDEVLPKTPTTASSGRPKPGFISEASILGVALLLGEPVAYAEEKHGALVQDVYPVAAESRSPSNESSGIDLAFHTELSYSRKAPERPLHLASPDFLVLLGLRRAPFHDAVTTVVEARDIARSLSDGARATLRRPLFELQAPYSYTGASRNRPWSRPTALFHGNESATTVAFDLACGVRGITPEAAEAVEELREVVSRPELQEHVRLEPGDLLVIHNRKCAHARSRFRADFDGSDRWLQRVYVRKSLEGLERPGPASTSFRVL